MPPFRRASSEAADPIGPYARSNRAVEVDDPLSFIQAKFLPTGADTQVLWGGLLEVITALACIDTAVVLYPVVLRQHGGAALGFATARVLEAGLIVTGIVSMLPVVTLRQPAAAGDDAAARVVAAESLVAVHDWTFFARPRHPARRQRVAARLPHVPHPARAPNHPHRAHRRAVLPDGGAANGLNEPASIWTVLVTLPIFAWEFALGVWLTIKDFRPSPVLARAVNAQGRDGAKRTHVA